MGLYIITVVGEGPHDNDNTNDSDYLTAYLVKDLKERGHRIYDASFTTVSDDGTRRSLEVEDDE